MRSWNWQKLAAEKLLPKQVEQYKSRLPGSSAPLSSMAKLGRTPVRDSPLAFGLNGLTGGSSPVIESIYSKQSTLFVSSYSAT
jgi:hypothetical protein